MNSDSPKISIIIPVYNTEKYLEKCLESIINQSYKDIEIICVNDGSKDNSLKILQKYAVKDRRIKVLDQKNMGVSNARNKALEIVKGTYFMFVDSDDWLALNTCEIAYNTIRENNADVLMYPYIREYKDTSIEKKIFDEDKVFNENECKKLYRRHIGIVKEELKKPESSVALCPVAMKLYKTDIQKRNNIKFIDTELIGSYEDGLFNLEYYKYITKAVYINQYLYHYRRSENNTLTTKYQPRLIEQRNYLFHIMKEYINKENLDEEFTEALNNKIAINIVSIGMNILKNGKSELRKIKDIKNILKSTEYHLAVKKLNLSYMPLHWRIFYTLCKFKISSLVYILLIIMTKLKKIV